VAPAVAGAVFDRHGFAALCWCASFGVAIALPLLCAVVGRPRAPAARASASSRSHLIGD